MRVIICGAGAVGYSVADYLSREENDVTVIDNNPKLIAALSQDLDVNGLTGHASNPDVLSAAGANNADLIIAVTHADEVNMIACQVGHSLFGIPKKIARIREKAYLDPAWSNLFSRSHMPIDVTISPETVIAEDIFLRLSVPGTTYVISMGDGKAHTAGVICQKDCPVLNTPIEQLINLFPDLAFEIVFIVRNNKTFIPDKDDQLEEGDEAFFVVDTRHLKRALAAFGHEEKEARRVIVSGGGTIGFELINLLREKSPAHIKIIEKDPKRAAFLSENLPGIVVLEGSSLDKELLEEASVHHAETFVAVTNDNEGNILGSLLAKQHGCERAIALVNNNAYLPLIGPLGIDAMVSPRATIVATIMKHIRRGRVRGLHNIRDGAAEIIEAEVSESCVIANSAIRDIDLPDNVKIGAIIRGEEVLMPRPDRIVRPDDLVIVLAGQEQARAVEKMFSVPVAL